MQTSFFEKLYLVKAKNKDPKAFAKVYDLYIDKIYRFVFFKVSSQEEAQDLTSEVFLKTWQYIIDGKEIKNLNAFLYKIARNLIIDHYRKVAQQKETFVDNKVLEQQEIAMDGLKKLEQNLQISKIEEKLMGLKDEYREIIILKYVEGLSIKEIAQIVEKKSGNVRVILYRALNTLKELMGE